MESTPRRDDDDRLRRSRVAAEIRAEMARQRISAPELLRRSELQITLPTLRNRLHGKSPFMYEELVLITRALGVGISAFAASTEAHQ